VRGCSSVSTAIPVAVVVGVCWVCRMQPTRTPEDQKGLADLDAELAASAQALGEPLHWTAAEAQLRELLADTMDRRGNLAAKYPRTRDRIRESSCRPRSGRVTPRSWD